MTHALQSYSEGRWQDGPGEQRPLLDAATGEVVATIPARGPDAAVQGHPDLLARLIPGGTQDLEGER